MKVKLILAALAAAISVLSAAGCAHGAVPGEPLDTNNSSGGGDAPAGLFVLGYEHDADFKFFVWQPDGTTTPTFTTENDPTGGLKCVAANNLGWAGGSFANVSSDTTPTFNFANVTKIKFKIKSNIASSQIHYILGFSVGEYNKTLSELGYSSLSATAWTPVEIDLSSAKSGKTITSGFSFVLSDDAGDKIASGEWISVRDIDWVDASGNSVDITN